MEMPGKPKIAFFPHLLITRHLCHGAGRNTNSILWQRQHHAGLEFAVLRDQNKDTLTQQPWGAVYSYHPLLKLMMIKSLALILDSVGFIQALTVSVTLNNLLIT